MIRTYLLNIEELENISYDEAVFSTRRREIIEKRKQEDDKKRARAAELLLIYALRQLDPHVKLPLVISEEEKGKPFLETKLDLSDELKKAGFRNGKVFFNISHAHDFAAVSISNLEIGVDIEWIKRKAIEKPEKLLHPKEQETIAFITNPMEKQKYFFECWTLKEAYLKQVGTGINIKTDEIFVEEDKIESKTVKTKKRYAHCSKPGEVKNTDWHFDANYKISVCSMYKDKDTSIENLSAEAFKNLFL